MAPLAAVFVGLTVLWTILSLYLSSRQSAHVAAHRDRVPAPFAGDVTLDEHRKAADYTLARERVSRIETIVDAAVTIFWAVGGIGLLYGAVASLVSGSLLRGVVFLVATGFVSTLIGLPFSIYRTFRLEQRFGFNNTDARTFILDRVKGGILSLAITVPLLVGVLWLMQRLSGLWWLWTWFGLLAIMVAAPTVYMRFIAPRFNTFAPLADPTLRTRIESLLARAGYRSSGLYTMDASRRTSHGNAFFIGFGRTKRIVMFDTLLARCAPDEVEAVVAHELGHFLHRHVVFGLMRGAVMSLIGLAAFGWLAKQPWLLPSFGVGQQNEALALYVCLLLVSLVGPLSAPFSHWISRRNEYQADAYAGRTVGTAPMISALTRLARDNASTLTPDPVYALMYHSHPTVPLRVEHLRALDRRPPAEPFAAEPSAA